MVSGQTLVKFSAFSAQGVVLMLELVGLGGDCGLFWQLVGDEGVTGTGAGADDVGGGGSADVGAGVGAGVGVVPGFAVVADGLGEDLRVGLGVLAGSAALSDCAPGPAAAASAVTGPTAATARPSAGAATAASTATAILLIPMPPFDRTGQSNQETRIADEKAATFAGSFSALTRRA
jgi:hypothetical protein